MSSVTEKNVLAIDTSTRILRLGLQFGKDRLVKSIETIERSHSQFIFKKIGELFQSAELPQNHLNAIVVGTGPGSFTGLRVGLAAAKGIAIALHIPMVDISSFEIAAHRLRQIDSPVFVVVPLNREESIIYQVEGGRYNQNQILVVKYTDFFDLVGSNAVAAMDIDLVSRFPEMTNEDYSDYLRYDAADLLYLGAEKIAAGKYADIATLEPRYLQKSQAEIRFEECQRHN